MTHGMISAAQPAAAEAGADVLRAGGNVVDAGIAAALVQTAVDPQMCGIAGMGSMQILLDGVHTTLDFHGRSPRAIRPEMWENRIIREADDGWGFILDGRVNEFGYQAMTTPRTLAAFDEALRRFGTRGLPEVMAPAIDYARNGCLVRPHVAEWWNKPAAAGRPANIDVVMGLPAARKIYAGANGGTLAVGQTLRNPDMARTYERIVEHGAAGRAAGGGEFLVG